MIKLTFAFKDLESLNAWKLQLHRDKTLGGEWLFNDKLLIASKILDLSDSANFPTELLAAFGVDYFKLEKDMYGRRYGITNKINPYEGLHETIRRGTRPLEDAIEKLKKPIRAIVLKALKEEVSKDGIASDK